MALTTRRIKQYTLINRPPGVGGFGEVWEAADQTNQRLVALKVLTGTRGLQPEEIKRFLLEYQVLSQLKHPNIVQVFECDRDPEQGLYFIAMEFIDGVTMKQLLRENKMTPEGAVRVVRDCLSALTYVHRVKTSRIESVVHRDIKPGNIMIERQSGRTVLLDFGIAKVKGAIRDSMHSRFQQGTVEYMSPEQFKYDEQGRPIDVDSRSDLYSMGVVLYEGLTGHPPFRGGEAGHAHTNLPIPTRPLDAPAPPRRPVPQHLRRVVLKALEKNPDLRYQTADEMLQALARPARVVRPSPLRRTLTWTTALVLGLAAAWAHTTYFQARGALAVWAEPQGLLVLDGGRREDTPVRIRNLTVGRHEIELVDRLGGARTVRHSLEVVPDGTVGLHITGDRVETLRTVIARREAP